MPEHAVLTAPHVVKTSSTRPQWSADQLPDFWKDASCQLGLSSGASRVPKVADVHRGSRHAASWHARMVIMHLYWMDAAAVHLLYSNQPRASSSSTAYVP